LVCAVVPITATALVTPSVSTAAEPPEIGRCLKKGVAEGSGYSNATCTTAATGSEAKYEWVAGPGPKAGFISEAREVPTLKDKRCKIWKKEVEAGHTETAEADLKKWHYTAAECEKTLAENESKEPVVLETVTGTKIECGGVTATGEYSGAKSVANVKATFSECVIGNTEVSCNSPGAKVGEITSSSLEGVLGVIKKESNPANSKVGVRLQASPLAANVAEFSCGTGINVVVTGSVIHEVTRNKMLLTETEKFDQAHGEQKPENFEGGFDEVLKSSLNGETPVQAGEGLLTKLVNEEKMEVNTVA